MNPVAVELTNWSQITAAFDSFPPPRLSVDSEGYLTETTWIFRGHKSTVYELEPRVERQKRGKIPGWATLESMLLGEFQSKAPLYMNASDLPKGDKLSWLALMQHYGVPTRLLDFSYSPYVALYFALRERSDTELASDAALWAIDANAVAGMAEPIFADAKGRQESAPVSFLPEDTLAAREIFEDNRASWNDRVCVAVSPRGPYRIHFNDKGYVDLALPPVQSLRLSSQQGVFLLNGAEDRSFSDSLFTMMNGYLKDWCRLFHVPTAILADVERRLFQMNIHDLALFPDTEGIAGFVRQKSRLHFAPQASSAKT